MSVVIEEMNMPANCYECACSEGYGCGVTSAILTSDEMKSRPTWCPMIEVKKRVQKIYQDPMSYTEKNWWEKA